MNEKYEIILSRNKTLTNKEKAGEKKGGIAPFYTFKSTNKFFIEARKIQKKKSFSFSNFRNKVQGNSLFLGENQQIVFTRKN